jgi:pimeloyl-ACP methyl ester carboxylesterase
MAERGAARGLIQIAHGIFGHSMGSFAAQQYVLDHSYSIDGLALSGSGALDGLASNEPPWSGSLRFCRISLIPVSRYDVINGAKHDLNCRLRDRR